MPFYDPWWSNLYIWWIFEAPYIWIIWLLCILVCNVDGVCWHRRTNLFLESTLESSKRLRVYLHVWHNAIRHLASERLITMHPGQRLWSILRCEIECCAELYCATMKFRKLWSASVKASLRRSSKFCSSGQQNGYTIQPRHPISKSFKTDAGWLGASKKSISMSSGGKGIKDQTPRDGAGANTAQVDTWQYIIEVSLVSARYPAWCHHFISSYLILIHVIPQVITTSPGVWQCP